MQEAHDNTGGGGGADRERGKRRRHTGKKRRAAAADDDDAVVVLDAAPSDLVTNYLRRLAEDPANADLCNARYVDPILKSSRPGLLRELSGKVLGEEPLEQSLFAFVVVRECERLIELYRATGAGDGATSERDVERVERRADDFVLRARDETDVRHRTRLWVARCKLTALRVAMRHAAAAAGGDGGAEVASSASSSSTANAVGASDPMRMAARDITDEMLARWMSDNKIGNESVVRRVPDNGGGGGAERWEHAIDKCGLASLWALIKSFRSRWCFLQLSPFLYALLERLRVRVAFFLGYREPFDESYERNNQLNSVKIIGLSRSAWRAADPLWVHGSRYDARRSASEPVAHRRNEALLNYAKMMRTVGVGAGAQRFSCVNDDFIEETERTLNAMLIELRKCAGFEWHERPDESECDCFACAELVSRDAAKRAELDAAKRALDTMVTREITGNFRDYVQMEFRTHVWAAYVQPGEAEVFRAYRPLDNETPQSIISRGRPDDGKVISRRFCERAVSLVWAEFATRDERDAERDALLVDYTQRSEPSCAMLTRQTLGFYLDAQSNGAQFARYLIDCHANNAPHTYQAERLLRQRRTLAEFHTPLHTTGTLAWRYKHQRRVGQHAPDAEMHYEHPLILRTLASFCVLYSGRMHLCANFSEAFLVWLATMCEDPQIGGELHTDYSLLPLYASLFPRRAEHVAALRRDVEQRKRTWDPMARLFPKEVTTERKQFERGVLQY